jgi:hypothetical protein
MNHPWTKQCVLLRMGDLVILTLGYTPSKMVLFQASQFCQHVVSENEKNA